MASSSVLDCRNKCFIPADFFSQPHLDDVFHAFWKGHIMLVEQADIENDDFWVENTIFLAVSLASCLQDEDGGWYHYSFGRKSLNIPVRDTPGMTAQRVRSCLPYIVGVLAAGRGIALHCSDVERDGMFGLLMIVLALSPPRLIGSEGHALHIAQAIFKKWYHGAALPEETVEARCSSRSLQAFVNASQIRIATLMLEPTVPSCFWNVGSTGFGGRFTVDEAKRHWTLVPEILSCDATPDSQLEQLHLLLTASQVGVLHGLPIDMIEQFRQGAARAARVGGGKGGESSGKGDQNMGHGKSSGKSDAPQRPEPTPKPRPSSSPSVSLLRPRIKPTSLRGSSGAGAARAPRLRSTTRGPSSSTRRPGVLRSAQRPPSAYPAGGLSSTWGSGTAAQSAERPPSSACPARSSKSIWGPGDAERSQRRVTWRVPESAADPDRERFLAAVVQTQVDFLKEVCRVPLVTIMAKEWARWRNASGWTILHCMAEHLNNQRRRPGWLNAVGVEAFIRVFQERSGNVDAVIEQGPGEGYTALHMVANRVLLQRVANRVREVAGCPAQDKDIIRFVTALIEHRANVNLPACWLPGRVPLTLAIASGHMDVARLLAKHGADPERRDLQGETVWDVCDQQHPKRCRELRCMIKMSKWPSIREL